LTFKQIRHRRLYQEIIQQVKAQVISGELAPGDRIPSEREIAEQLGVSRTAVREALIAMEVMGLVESRPGDGTFVRTPRTEQQLEPLASLVVLEREKLTELYEMRRVMEVACASRAATRATPEQLVTLRGWLKQMEADLHSGELGEEADFRFHLAIAESTHNSLLLHFMHTISAGLRQVMIASRQRLYRMDGMPELLLEEHRSIYAAIAAQDPERASVEMRRHLDGVSARVLNVDADEPAPAGPGPRNSRGAQ
jgi:GntR family transcriptional repressor for pyruvate dehydrogenase complex